MLFWDKLTFQVENIWIISGLATHNSPAVLCCWFSSVQEQLIQKSCCLQYPSPSPNTWYSWNMGSYSVLYSAERETYDQSNHLRSSKCYQHRRREADGYTTVYKILDTRTVLSRKGAAWSFWGPSNNNRSGGNPACLKRCSSMAQVQLTCVALLQQAQTASEEICCHHCPTECCQVLPVNQ